MFATMGDRMGEQDEPPLAQRRRFWCSCLDGRCSSLLSVSVRGRRSVRRMRDQYNVELDESDIGDNSQKAFR